MFLDDAIYIPLAFTVSWTNETAVGANDGTFTMAGKGGVPTYQYKIGAGAYQGSGTFTALAPGTYTLTVKDSDSFTFSDSFVIYAAVDFTYVATGDTGPPANGSIVVTASGGRTPYTYSKDGVTYQASNTFSGLTNGTYEIYVKDYYSTIVHKTVLLSTYEPELTVWLTGLADPTTAQKTAYNDFLVALKTAWGLTLGVSNLDTKVFSLSLQGAFDYDATLKNFIAARPDMVRVGYILANRTVNKGYLSDANGKYLKCSFNLKADASAAIGVDNFAETYYLAENTMQNGAIISGALDGAGNGTYVYPKEADGFTTYKFNSAGSQNHATASTDGTTTRNRADNAQIKIYRKGVLDATKALASSDFPNTESFLDCLSADGVAVEFNKTFTRFMHMFHCSVNGTVAAAIDAAIVNLYNAVNP